MSSVCGGSWPRDAAIKKTKKKPQGQIIQYHTQSGLPSLSLSDAHPLLFTFFFVIRPTYSQRAPCYARPRENSINTAGRKGGIFWSKHGDAACRYMFYVKPRSPGLRHRSPLFLGTQRWTCATNGSRFNNKTWLLLLHFRPGGSQPHVCAFQAAAR